jgi:hypothetical protein
MLYVLAVVAVLAMLIPLAASPVSAQTPTITPATVHDIIGDTETFTVSGLGALTVTGWTVTNTPNGMANAFITSNTSTTVSVQAFGWGEAAVTAILSNNTTVTAFKKWGKIDATIISGPQNVPVVWNETFKVFSATANITDTVIGTFLLENPTSHDVEQFHEPAAGAVLNWFLLKDNPATQAWLAGKLSGGTPVGWWTSAALLADLNNPANAAWRATFAYFGAPGTTSTMTTSGAGGTSTVTVGTFGEEAVLVVVVPAYPGPVSTELQVPIEWTKINFWTREMEKVPQVRWAGEKIVLEKFFGTGLRPNEATGDVPSMVPWPGTLVRFSLENQSPGALEGIGPGANLGNFTNSAQTVWSIIGQDGYARCILVSEAPGEVDVDLAVYNENIFAGGDGSNLLEGTIINQHGFVVFYLKLEDITIGNVAGKRAGHNTGLWEPSNPWNPATDVMTETLNVSQDALLRARVRGWFMGDNLSTRAARVQDYDLFNDSDGNGIPNDDADVLLPAGRWILPDDWPKLAGPDWQEQRLHWDIMDNPFDTVRSLAPTTSNPTAVGYYGKVDVNPAAVGYHGSGPYYQPNPPQGALKAAYPVVGPFRPGIEEPTFDGYNPNILPFAVPQQKSVVPNGALDWWDAPMPPAKITFEIMNGNGFFKDAWKSDIYYIWGDASKTARYYTNPFYFEMIPASWYIPAFVNNGGYDWDSWAGVTVSPNGTVTLPTPSTPVAWAPYGPYEFWKIINRPLPTAVSSSDMANFPTKVQVYSDNHGEAMVFLNGNWNLNLGAWLTNGAVDVPQGTVVGTTNVVAMADYPYFRKHPKVVSTNVTKTWTWGGVVLGTDLVTFPGGTMVAPSPMILSTGTYTIVGNPNFPNDVGTSPKKLVWLWITDRDISPAGVRDTVIQWSVTGGGTVTIADFGFVHGISNYNNITQNIDLQNGFLAGTNGSVTPGTAKTQGVSKVRAPTAVEQQLFLKFFPALDPTDFVVAAVELLTANSTIDVTVQALITSRDFAAAGNPVGTLIRNINVDFAAAYPLDDEPIYGDANADGVVNMGDVIAVERIILGLKTPYIGADANIDRKINMGDVIKIEKIILGLD